MRPLSFAIAALALIALVMGQQGDSAGVIGMGIVGLLLAVVTFRSPALPFFLMIFSGIFGAEYVVFGAGSLLAHIGAWPTALQAATPPTSLATTVGVFGILIYAISFLPVIERIARLASPYFQSSDITTAKLWPIGTFSIRQGVLGVMLLTFLIVLNQTQVGISLRLSFFNRDMYDALQNKDAASFWYQLFYVFCFWAAISVISNLIETFANYTVLIRWRRWMTLDYTQRWLGRGEHYRIALAGSVDNPDQRIAEDTRAFVNSTYNYTLPLLTQVSTLVSFSIILWNIPVSFTFPGTSIPAPGYLFWIVTIYAVVATWLTHLIGRPLIALEFEQEKREATFRFSLARLREYSEQIALMVGEPTERVHLAHRFGDIVINFYRIVWARLKLGSFTSSYNQISVVLPYIVLAPYYFAGTITLGIMMQVAGAFDRVQTALSFIIDRYQSLASYLASIDRLTTFEAAIVQAQALPIGDRDIHHTLVPGARLDVTGATLALPDGRPIVRVDNLSLGDARSTLLIGPSGSGKSTLFRAIAGIWPFGAGKVEVPEGAHIMLLPQRPYLPQGTLRAALAYPATEDAYSDAEVKEAMAKVKLAHLADKLDEVDLWGQRLSGGEQQRLAVARALLARPDWLFLDEATASLDEKLEGEIYDVIDRTLPNTKVVSIGHRSTLRQMHDEVVTMQPNTDGTYSPKAMAAEPA
ncbi:ABC transporter ATP-binding protein/permease [Bosea sp. BK604]|uniref:ABC transporter ATP-binding protein/permease n=1 Tax=Bosea sp. BK604 TaxID=2512180 RepID=UPI00104C4C78|nr:ABC transporter ATP-binding protein/permease [Bosea sp. BK604]TCR65039.1 putative ATP-binding cassette transporter [Bosea sp. BK604]